MKPEVILPKKIVALYNASLIPHLPNPAFAVPYAVIPAPGLGRVMGFPWWQALTRTLDVPALFDAGDAPALAASAFRAGATWVICTCPAPSIITLKEIARLCRGHVLSSRPDALTLGRPPYNAYRIALLMRYLAQPS